MQYQNKRPDTISVLKSIFLKRELIRLIGKGCLEVRPFQDNDLDPIALSRFGDGPRAEKREPGAWPRSFLKKVRFNLGLHRLSAAARYKLGLISLINPCIFAPRMKALKRQFLLYSCLNK